MKSATKIWIQVVVAALLLAGGVAIGTGLKAEGLNAFWKKVAFYKPPDEADEEDAGGAVDNTILEISETAVKNLKLETGLVTKRDYSRSIEIPATVVERLPSGRRNVTAPISGTVSQVFIAPSEAIRSGDRLYELNVTDNAVTDSQVKLIGLMSDIEVADKQIKRLKPLVAEGSVTGKRLLDVEFEIEKLKANYDAACQELLLRGLNADQLAALIQNRELIQTLTIYAPDLPDAESSDETNQWYTVEDIQALAGSNLARGESLCTLTYHGQLFIEGYAYESDLETLAQNELGSISVVAEFGETNTTFRREGLSVHSISNHVHAESQTYPIYVAISNEIQAERTDDSDRSFITWRFKPGQRAHLLLPVEKWENQVIVPIDAVVQEGPQAHMFLQIPHSHEIDGELHQEFKRVSVHITYQDKDVAIINTDSGFSTRATYALNKAYQLNLALKRATAGGGGHSHEH